jgi:hypothetical protein
VANPAGGSGKRYAKEILMSNEVHIFQPIRRQIGFWCGVIFLGILINVHYLLDSSSMILYVSFVFLIGMFVFLFVPFLKNQKLIITDEDIRLFTFGRMNRLMFCKHLKGIVVKENEAVSYRFENRGKYYQISPRAYYESEELKTLFNDLMEKCKSIVSVVEK